MSEAVEYRAAFERGFLEATRPVLVMGNGGHSLVVCDALRGMRRHFVAAPHDVTPAPGQELCLGMGRRSYRRKCAERFGPEWRWATVIHPTAWVSPSAQIGEGAQIMAGAIVQAGAVIGKHAIINTGAQIDHGCRIGDFAHICPGAVLCADVVVDEGAMVPPGEVIERGSVVANVHSVRFHAE